MVKGPETESSTRRWVLQWGNGESSVGDLLGMVWVAGFRETGTCKGVFLGLPGSG